MGRQGGVYEADGRGKEKGRGKKSETELLKDRKQEENMRRGKYVKNGKDLEDEVALRFKDKIYGNCLFNSTPC